MTWRDHARANRNTARRVEWAKTTHKRGPALRYFIPFPDTNGQDVRVIARTVEGGVEVALIEFVPE